MENGIDISASQDDKYGFVIKIASGKSNIDEIKSWLMLNCISITK